MKIYELRHDNDLVMFLEVDENYRISNIGEIINKNKIPIGLEKNSKIKTYDMNEWVTARSIPAKREGIDYILEKENVNSVNELIIKNNGLSMTDHYWIVEKNSYLEWGEINYFENDERFGKLGDDIYIGKNQENVDQGRTPSSSASGMQPKMWVLYKNKKCLLKASEEISQQEPFSEYAASLILDKLDINHVKYSIIKRNNDILSICPNMLDNRSDLISAWYVCNEKRLNHESSMDHYIRRCGELGIEGDIRTPLEQMIAVDYLIANTDRHWNNFSIIRNSITLKGERPAPLYDHGAAFFTKYHHLHMIDKNEDLECRSFRKRQEDNLKFVKNIDWLRRNVLNDIPDIVRDVMKNNPFGSTKRTDTILSCIRHRIMNFRKNMGIPPHITTAQKTDPLKPVKKKKDPDYGYGR